MKIFINDIATHIPETKISAEELNQKYGIPLSFLKKMKLEEKPVSAENEHPACLAERAVKKLLERNQVASDEIDLIVYANSGLNDLQFWSPAANIQNSISARNAFCFDIINGCNSGNSSLSVIRSMMQTSSSMRNALLVISETLSKFVDHSDPKSYHLANLSDGAAAILLSKNPGPLEICSHHFRTDSRFLNYYCLPKACSRTDIKETKYILPIVEKPENLSLRTEYIRNFQYVINQALEGAKLNKTEMNYLFINQGDHSVAEEIRDIYEMTDEKMHNSYAKYGHIGGVDVFLALENFLQEEHSGPQNIVLASSAIGFSWGATVLKTREEAGNELIRASA